MLPRVSVGICTCLAVRRVHNTWATSRSRPGRLTLNVLGGSKRRPNCTSLFCIDGYVGRKLNLMRLATSPIALMKQADQPAANNCSGFVPVPGTPGDENLTSKRAIITMGDAAAPDRPR